MSEVKIFHNPRCSKSRQTLALLQELGVEPTIIEYLDSPPSTSELKSIVNMLGITPRELIRTGESIFKELGLNKNDERSVEEWLTILSENPKLIQRPVVIRDQQAVIGRPPELVKTLFD